MALITSISLSLITALTKSIDMGVAPEARMNLLKALSLASGVAAGQADKIFTDERTIAASGTDDLDLAGVLVDALGDVITFARVKALIVIAEPKALTPVNTNNVIIGAAASAQWLGPFGAATHTVALQPGQALAVWASGATAWPVTATTADLLRLANSAGGTSVIYQIAIIGASA